MAFSGDGRPLTGADGTLYKASLGTTLTFGTTLTAGTLYLITSVDASTGFPAIEGGSGGTAATAGRLIKGNASITLAASDAVKPLTLTELYDISSWKATFTADEIETTTFTDPQKTYDKGKVDFSGSLSGVVKIGYTVASDGVLVQFIDIVEQDGNTSYTVFQQASSLYLLYLVANKTTSKGDTISMFLPVNIYSSGIGADQGAADTFDSTFRIATDSDGIIPAIYRFT